MKEENQFLYRCYDCREIKKGYLYPRLKLSCKKCINYKIKELSKQLEHYKKLKSN